MFSVFSGNTQESAVPDCFDCKKSSAHWKNIAYLLTLVAEHSMLLGRPPRTTWNQILFVCAARRVTQMQQNEGANDQAVQSLKSTCFGCRPAQHHAQTHASRFTICTWSEDANQAHPYHPLHILSKSSCSYQHISSLPPPHFYRPTPNYLHMPKPPQSTQIYHAPECVKDDMKLLTCLGCNLDGQYSRICGRTSYMGLTSNQTSNPNLA